MKKLLVFLLIGVLLVSTAGTTLAYNDEKKDLYVVKEIKLSNGKKIEKMSDGRVSPVKFSNELQIDDLNTILTEMNFHDEDLQLLNIDSKKEIVTNGGVKVDTTQTFASHEFIYNGKEYNIEGKNMEEVKIKENLLISDNLVENNEESLIGIQSVLVDGTNDGYDMEEGIWHGYSYVIYVGLNPYGTEYVYDVYNIFEWDNDPFFEETDEFGLAWEVEGSNIPSYSYGFVDGYYLTTNPGWYSSTWEFFVPFIDDFPTSGSGRERIQIPIEGNEYTWYNISACYVHNWSALPVSLSVLGLNWDISGLTADFWEWQEGFYIRSYY